MLLIHSQLTLSRYRHNLSSIFPGQGIHTALEHWCNRLIIDGLMVDQIFRDSMGKCLFFSSKSDGYLTRLGPFDNKLAVYHSQKRISGLRFTRSRRQDWTNDSTYHHE